MNMVIISTDETQHQTTHKLKSTIHLIGAKIKTTVLSSNQQHPKITQSRDDTTGTFLYYILHRFYRNYHHVFDTKLPYNILQKCLHECFDKYCLKFQYSRPFLHFHQQYADILKQQKLVVALNYVETFFTNI